MDVLVVGAGIGGLTLALALHEAGIGVRVVEAARELRPLGVGINVLPHAIRELAELGLGAELAATGVATRRLVFLDRLGNAVWEEPRGEEAGYRWPQYSIHRGQLQMLLLGAVRRRLGDGALRTATVFEGFEQDGEQVRASLHDRATGTTSVASADVLVGADGIRSAVRAQLHPREGAPLWNGIHMWRGATPMEPFLDGRTMVIAGSNHDAKIVVYPITETLVNWVAEVTLRQGRTVEPGDWDRAASLDDVLPHFEGWRFDWLDVPAMMAAAEGVWEYPMIDRDPVGFWSRGRVTLLGDAAHPMYPMGSNGGTQAIIDARVLAWHLWHAATPEEGLAAYERARLGPMAELVHRNREMGPEKVLMLVAERAPHGFERLEDVLSAGERGAIAEDYKRQAGMQVEQLNARASLSVPR